MNLSVHPHHRRHLRPAVRRVLTVTVVACIAVGGASFVLHSRSAVPAASATSTSSASAASEAESSLLTARQAQAILDDPRMVLVNHTNKMPDDHTFTTKACGSATAVNKTLQTEAADAFLAMQAAAAKDGVTIWMQSGYRSVDYQKNLYDQKTQYFRNKGLSEAEAKKQAANIVNPPGYSEHNCGLAADLHSPEHTALTEGFAEIEPDVTISYDPTGSGAGITYEPWHWRYVGPENAALIQQSGLCFEDAVAVLQKLAAGEKITG